MKQIVPIRLALALLSALCFFRPGEAYAQANGALTLTGTGYTQNFDDLGSGVLPDGWSVHTGATGTTLGELKTLFSGGAATPWNNTSGGVKNFAAATGLTSGADQTTQNGAADRALGVRQVAGSNSNFPNSDPGAAFVLQLANTSGYKDFALSFKLLSLDITSPRATTWQVQYGVENGGSYTFTTVGSYTTGNGAWGEQVVTIDFAGALDNKSVPVWIRVAALGGSVNTGNRPSTGIDDFALTYSQLNVETPYLTASPSTLQGFGYTEGTGPSASQPFQLSAGNLAPASGTISVEAPAGYEVSLEASANFTNLLQLPYENGIRAATPVYVRLSQGLAQGSYSGVPVVVTGGGLSASVAVSGAVGAPVDPTQPCGAVSIAIAQAREKPVGEVVTITGRVTAVTLANNNIYLRDGAGATDGILLFDNGSLRPSDLAVGDEVQVTGTRAVFNGMIQLSGLSCFKRTDAAGEVPQPVTITGAQLCQYEGQLVSVADVSIPSGSGRFAGNTTYTLSNNTPMYVHNNTGIGGASIPQGTLTVTGIVTLYQGTCQLSVRTIADIPGAVPAAPCGMQIGAVTNDEKKLEVVNWNVEWLGHSSNGTGPGQLANVQSVINTVQADVYMLQEVCSYNAATPEDPSTAFGALLQGLNAAFPSRLYKGECSPAYSYSYIASPDPQGQRVCIIYRADQITKIASKPLLTEVDLAPYGAYPTGDATQFWSSGRVPFLFEADITLDGKTARMNFIGVHSKANTNPQDVSYARRRYDHRVFYDYLLTDYPDANIIIAGDFNDDMDQSIYQYGSNHISSWSPFLYANPLETDVNGVRPSADWTALTYKFSGTGCSSSNGFSTFIDHVMVSNEIPLQAPGARTAAAAAVVNFTANTVETLRGSVSSGSSRASDHYPTFTQFTLVNESLPVTLYGFEAREAEGQVVLGWHTTQEVNNAFFEIERSADGRNFEVVGKVNGAGTASGDRRYTFTDTAPLEGLSYYRLRQVDHDGSYRFSPLAVMSRNVSLQIGPVPASDVVYIHGAEEVRSWQLLSLTGLPLQKGHGRLIDVTSLESGIYLFRAETTSGVVVTRKLVKY